MTSESEKKVARAVSLVETGMPVAKAAIVAKICEPLVYKALKGTGILEALKAKKEEEKYKEFMRDYDIIADKLLTEEALVLSIEKLVDKYCRVSYSRLRKLVQIHDKPKLQELPTIERRRNRLLTAPSCTVLSCVETPENIAVYNLATMAFLGRASNQ